MMGQRPGRAYRRTRARDVAACWKSRRMGTTRVVIRRRAFPVATPGVYPHPGIPV